MRRTITLSGRLPTPPNSVYGSQLCGSASDIEQIDNQRSSSFENNINSIDKRESRVLRSQSTLNVREELCAFFAASTIPSGKNKRDFLVSAIQRISSFHGGTSTKSGHNCRRSQEFSPELPNDEVIPVEKNWLTSGLYAGLCKPKDNPRTLGKGPKSHSGPEAERKFKFPLPMLEGKMLMDQPRDFRLPWNLYAATGKSCKPPNWSRIRRSMNL
jgi:hypothetical protein